jgi:hypothetical protein
MKPETRFWCKTKAKEIKLIFDLVNSAQIISMLVTHSEVRNELDMNF